MTTPPKHQPINVAFKNVTAAKKRKISSLERIWRNCKKLYKTALIILLAFQKDGVYDKSFYGEDMFHLSKYGNAVLGKFLWNSMLEPVGSKSDNVNLGHDSVPLKCPTKASFFLVLGML